MSRVFTALPEVAIDGAPEMLSCAWRHGFGARWATLAGELDASTAPLLDEALHDAEVDAQLIVLDLRALAFIDCTGVRAIFQSSERLRQSGRLMAVVRGPRPVDKVFTLTRVAETMQIFDLEPAEPAFQVLPQLAPTYARVGTTTDYKEAARP